MHFEPHSRRVFPSSFIPTPVNDVVASFTNPSQGAEAVIDGILAKEDSYDAEDVCALSSRSTLPDLSKFDLTVGEALDVFPQERRKRPSDRTLQRYCQDGRFDCYKLKTTRNGNPVHEWIINSDSLLKFIHTKQIESSGDGLATSDVDGVATGGATLQKSAGKSAVACAPLRHVGDAEVKLVLPRSLGDQPPDTAMPEELDAASPNEASRVELLIENAKMTAKLDAQNELIGELREDKKFMREQVIHYRQNDTLMFDMHRETLQTLKAVSIAGRHTKVEMPEAASSRESRDNFFDASDVRKATQDVARDDV